MAETPSKLVDDCFRTDKKQLRHDDALAILKARLAPVATPEPVALSDAGGRFLAEPLSARRDVPATDNAAVDGYAFAAADYQAAGGWFPVITRIAAGDTQPVALPKGAAARIFTGAVMPQGADTIAMQEDCEPHEQGGTHFVAIPQGLNKGANRRRAGEDLKTGAKLAEPGERLDAPTIAAAASVGIDRLCAYAPLKIALISNGNELKRPGEAAEPGQVYDSNHFLLSELLRPLPVQITDYGVLPDNYDVIETALVDAAASHDVVVSSGGASRGEEDHVVTALERRGKRHLWQLAVKPGRPMSFGQIGDTVFFGLPGNPVAAFVCFLLYARPALYRLGGGGWPEPKRFFVPAGFALAAKKPDRREFWRGRYQIGEDGTPVLQKFGRDGSGLITGLRVSDGLIEVPERVTSVASGDLLRFIPYSEFGLW